MAMSRVVDKMDSPVSEREREPEPPPPKPPPHMKFKPGSIEWYKALPPPRSMSDDIHEGRAVSANVLRPVPRPPRAPGQLRRLSNGFWSYWS